MNQAASRRTYYAEDFESPPSKLPLTLILLFLVMMSHTAALFAGGYIVRQHLIEQARVEAEKPKRAKPAENPPKLQLDCDRGLAEFREVCRQRRKTL